MIRSVKHKLIISVNVEKNTANKEINQSVTYRHIYSQ